MQALVFCTLFDVCQFFFKKFFQECFQCQIISGLTFAGINLDPYCLQRLSADDFSRLRIKSIESSG